MPSIPPVGTSAYKAYARANGMPTIPAISTSIPAVPPTGTSAHKAYEYQMRTGNDPTVDGIKNLVNAIKDGVPNISLGSPFKGSSSYSGSSGGYYEGSSGGSSAPSVPELDYLYADLAKHYGLDATTAYQEALSNTAYQRAVKDMKAAGLNPAVIYGAGRGSTASGVGYVSQPEPPGGGGSGGGGYYSRGSSSKGYLFDQGTWGAISTAAGLVGMVATKSPTGFWIYSTAAKGVMGAMNSLFGR